MRVYDTDFYKELQEELLNLLNGNSIDPTSPKTQDTKEIPTMGEPNTQKKKYIEVSKDAEIFNVNKVVGNIGSFNDLLQAMGGRQE